jgi:hypothetical protein
MRYYINTSAEDMSSAHLAQEANCCGKNDLLFLPSLSLVITGGSYRLIIGKG